MSGTADSMPSTSDLTSCATVFASARASPAISSMAVSTGVETGLIGAATSGLSSCNAGPGVSAAGAGAGAIEKVN